MSRGVGRIQRHMEYIANTIEAMLDLLEIIQNLPAARNRDLVALLAIGCLVALSAQKDTGSSANRHMRQILRIYNGASREMSLPLKN